MLCNFVTGFVNQSVMNDSFRRVCCPGGCSPDIQVLTFSWTGCFVLSFISFEVQLCYVTLLQHIM